MKKILAYITILSILFTCVSCAKKPGVTNLPVGLEPFESLEIRPSFSDYKTYSSENEIYDDIDTVFIGMPINTFTDEKDIRYFDLEGNKVKNDGKTKFFNAYTVRKIKVLEVIKGSIKEDIIDVAEYGYVGTDEKGNQVLKGIPNDSFITKQNAKYIFYANFDENKNFYIAHKDNGKINIDGLDDAAQSSVSRERLSQAKARFESQFKKYDRTNEK